jgi:hypothetical protein
MANPSVVILTEPANCELVDQQVLLQALLQTQHLSEEGVPVSQAFCDNPAAASEFIDAYAKAYPGLVPQSPNLPPPEQLYSMIVSGRLAPLPGLTTAPNDTKLEDAAAVHSLLVLSLGKPDALMQALQSQRSAKSSVKVVEIAPDTEARTAPVSVAAAIASHTIGGTTSSADATSSQSGHGADDALSASDEGTNASLRLESVESNLDHIESNATGEQVHRSVPAGIVGPTPVSSADHAAPAPLAHVDASTTGSGDDTSLVSQSDPRGPTGAPAPEPTATHAPEPAVALAPEATAIPEPADSASDHDAVQGANASAELPEDSNRNAADPHAPESADSASDHTPPHASQGANASADVPGDSNRNAADPHAPESADSASDHIPPHAAQPSH